MPVELFNPFQKVWLRRKAPGGTGRTERRPIGGGGRFGPEELSKTYDPNQSAGSPKPKGKKGPAFSMPQLSISATWAIRRFRFWRC